MNLTSGNHGMRRGLSILIPAAALLLAAGCATGLDPKGVRPDPASIRKIGFRVDPELAGVRMDAAKLKDMAGRIAKNLGTWGYPIEANQGGSPGDYTHILEAKIDAVQHKSTPTGFSLSMGNSDPRAPDFQKADVVPVDCVLYPAARPKDRASMYMDFVAKDMSGDPATLNTYVDHMATVCFNLLEDSRVRRTQPAPAAAMAETPASASDAWFPEIRVEVRNKPQAPQPAGTAAPSPAIVPAATRAPTTVPVPVSSAKPAAVRAPVSAPVDAPAPASAPTAESAKPAESAPATPPQPPAVTTETATDPDNGKQEIIIHNQGSPIILEFGYERN